MCKKKWISLEYIKCAFLWLAWIFLIGNSLAQLLLDPISLGDIAGFSDPGTRGEGAKLILDTLFISYGLYYYFFLAYINNKKINFILFLPFLIYLIIFSGRASLLCLFLSLCFFIFKWKKYSTKSSFFYIFILGGFLLSLCFFIPIELISIFIGRFNEAYYVISTFQEGNDISANVRISEFNLALQYVHKNLFLGSGNISQQWYEGSKGFLGYFHPSDIGLLGAIFTYGVIGLVLFLSQIYFIVKYCKELPVNFGKYYNLSNAIKCLLLYYSILSITTGAIVFGASTFFFFIAILYSITLYNKIDPNHGR